MGCLEEYFLRRSSVVIDIEKTLPPGAIELRTCSIVDDDYRHCALLFGEKSERNGSLPIFFTYSYAIVNVKETASRKITEM